MEVNRQGYTLHLLNHPIFASKRDKEGTSRGFAPPFEGRAFGIAHPRRDRPRDRPGAPQGDRRGRDGGARGRARRRGRLAGMRERLQSIVKEIDATPPPIAKEEVDEIRAFLEWTSDQHFTFLGYREYELSTVDRRGPAEDRAALRAGSLREPKLGGISQSFTELPKEIKALAREPNMLVLTKANTRSTVHRPGYLDYIGVKRFDAQGRVIGERRFVGLYTSSAYHADPQDVPAAAPQGRDGRRARRIPAAQPRAQEPALGAAALPARRALPRRHRDPLRNGTRRAAPGRPAQDPASSSAATCTAGFYSCLIYLPRENYTTDTRLKIQEILKRHLGGTNVEFTVQLSDAALARIHMLVRTLPKDAPRFDIRAIEADIAQATRRWEDDLKNALVDAVGEEKAIALYRTTAALFPVAYRDQVPPRMAVRDLQFIESLTEAQPYAVSLYRPVEGDDRTLRLRVYRLGQALPLSEACRSSRTWASKCWTRTISRSAGRFARRLPARLRHAQRPTDSRRGSGEAAHRGRAAAHRARARSKATASTG
jgi:glutamate dehydrogenase